MSYLKLQVHFGGDIHELLVSSNGEPKVSDLMREIERSLSVPQDLQRLVFKGQILNEKPDMYLVTYGVKNSCLIRLVGRKGQIVIREQ